MININNNFKEEVLNNKGLTVVDFWAPWCGPCKIFGPIFEEVSEELKSVKFCKLNVDLNRDSAKENGVMSIPTIILFNDGKELKRHIGLLNYEELKKFITDMNPVSWT